MIVARKMFGTNYIQLEFIFYLYDHSFYNNKCNTLIIMQSTYKCYVYIRNVFYNIILYVMLIVGCTSQDGRPAKSARRSDREDEDMTHAYL
jgi:hypothetical protein